MWIYNELVKYQPLKFFSWIFTFLLSWSFRSCILFCLWCCASFLTNFWLCLSRICILIQFGSLNWIGLTGLFLRGPFTLGWFYWLVRQFTFADGALCLLLLQFCKFLIKKKLVSSVSLFVLFGCLFILRLFFLVQFFPILTQHLHDVNVNHFWMLLLYFFSIVFYEKWICANRFF